MIFTTHSRIDKYYRGEGSYGMTSCRRWLDLLVGARVADRREVVASGRAFERFELSESVSLLVDEGNTVCCGVD